MCRYEQALDHNKQMVIAILDSEHILQYSSAAEAAAYFPVAFTNIAKKVKAAAGMIRAAVSFCTMRAFKGMHFQSTCLFLTPCAPPAGVSFSISDFVLSCPLDCSHTTRRCSRRMVFTLPRFLPDYRH